MVAGYVPSPAGHCWPAPVSVISEPTPANSRLARGHVGYAGKQQRRDARERLAAYHEAQVAELLAHVATAIDKYRNGQLDVANADVAIHQYHRAAQELWKFCFSTGDVEFVSSTIDGLATPVDWWRRGEPRRPK